MSDTKSNPSKCVLQQWVLGLPWKMQSILFSSLRGPDQEFLINVKQISKWMRSLTQFNADPSKPYMDNAKLPKLELVYKELEHCPVHFVHHLLDGIAIIAYHHPEQAVCAAAGEFHYAVIEELFHFIPEPPDIFNLRHRDKKDGYDPLQMEWDNHADTIKNCYLDEVLKRFKKEPKCPNVN